MLSQSEISNLLNLLNSLDGGSDDEWDAIRILKDELGPDAVPLLAQKYKESRQAAVRASCVYHSMSHARMPEALQLGIQALKDRSKVVRYRAYMLLSFALDRSALLALREAAATSGASREDFLAAIDAIEHNNRHYFIDRTHSGKMKLVMEGCEDD